jgi:hypothetical protein
MVTHVEQHEKEGFMGSLGPAAFQRNHPMEAFLIEEIASWHCYAFFSGKVVVKISERTMQVHD